MASYSSLKSYFELSNLDSFIMLDTSPPNFPPILILASYGIEASLSKLTVLPKGPFFTSESAGYNAKLLGASLRVSSSFFSAPDGSEACELRL